MTRKRTVGLTFDDVRHIALTMPGVEERTSYGRPAFYVGKTMLACAGKQNDHIVVRMGFDERELRMEAEPGTYFITDHYRGWPYVLVRLATIAEDALARLLEQTRREVAPKARERKA